MQNYQTTLLLILALVHMLIANELDSEENLTMEGLELFDGDILKRKNTNEDNAVPNKMRWPEGRVPYKIKPGYDNNQLDMLKKAMDEFHKKTCIRFEEKKSGDKDYVQIHNGGSCQSAVGRAGGMQPLSLANGCFYHGTLVHELNHAVGFDHEQNRNDRDDYLNIHWDAIEEDNKHNFNKFELQQMIGTFDFDSVMLYGQTHFAINGQKSMTPKDPNHKLKDPKDKPGLSDGDVTKIKTLYGCK